MQRRTGTPPSRIASAVHSGGDAGTVQYSCVTTTLGLCLATRRPTCPVPIPITCRPPPRSIHPPRLGAEYDSSRGHVPFAAAAADPTWQTAALDTVDPPLQLWVSGGYEDDDYTFRSSAARSTALVRRGVLPPRTNLDAWWEHRFFGSSYSVDFTHRMPTSVWSVNASRNITSYPQSLATLPPGFDVGISQSSVPVQHPGPCEGPHSSISSFATRACRGFLRVRSRSTPSRTSCSSRPPHRSDCWERAIRSFYRVLYLDRSR